MQVHRVTRVREKTAWSIISSGIGSLRGKRANRGSCKCKTEIDSSSFVHLHLESWHFDAPPFDEQRIHPFVCILGVRGGGSYAPISSLTIKGAIKRAAKTRGSIILESVPPIENRFSLTEPHRSTVNRLIDRFVRPINRFDRVEPCDGRGRGIG